MLGFTAFLLPSADAAESIDVVVVAPTEGDFAVYGDEMRRGAQLAVDDINARGGINGEKIALRLVGDNGDPKSVARKVVASGVHFVVGHYNSGSSIPSSPIYAKKGVLMISPSTTNPMFTETGLWNTIRTSGRDDTQGTFAGEYIAQHFSGHNVALLDDDTPYGQGLARKAKAALNAAGMKEKLYAKAQHGKRNYSSLVAKMAAAKIQVVFFGGLAGELGRLIRQTSEAGLKVQFVTGDGAASRDLPSAGGPSVEGTLMAFSLDDRQNPHAKDVMERFQAQGFQPIAYTLKSYAAVQVIAKGIEIAGNDDPRAVARAIRSGKPIATILGDLGFDEKGDRHPRDVMMYVWTKDETGTFSFHGIEGSEGR